MTPEYPTESMMQAVGINTARDVRGKLQVLGEPQVSTEDTPSIAHTTVSTPLPKRPLSPYLFFSQHVSNTLYKDHYSCVQQRKILKANYPTWTTKQVMKFLTRMWNKMSRE